MAEVPSTRVPSRAAGFPLHKIVARRPISCERDVAWSTSCSSTTNRACVASPSDTSGDSAITPFSVLADSAISTLYPGGILNTGFAVPNLITGSRLVLAAAFFVLLSFYQYQGVAAPLSPLLLLGYEVYEWEFRILFRGIIRAMNDLYPIRAL